MISVKDILRAADRYEVVAAISDDLQPRSYVPAERTDDTVQVAGGDSASVVKPSKPVAAKQLAQRRVADTARIRSLPALPSGCAPYSRAYRFSRRGLRLG